MISENTEPFTDILEACVECNVPLVYASSAATYGSPKVADDRVPFPLDAAGMPNNVYGFSKWLMDVEVFRFFEQRLSANESLPHVVGLRYFNVFGPGESRKGKMASMVLHLTNQILDGQRPKLFKVGEHERDQVFVDDVVNCTIAGANPNAKPGVYNLGSGQTTSFNDIVDAINEALGMNVAAEYFDMPEKMVSTYQHYTCADMSETKNGLNWVPAWSPIDAMIRYARQIASERTSSSSVTSTQG
jgi:ADP-L-glycero-D-manno-heptose 6-epimerase